MKRMILSVTFFAFLICVGCNDSSVSTAVGSFGPVIWSQEGTVYFRVPVLQEFHFKNWPEAKPVWFLELYVPFGAIILNSPPEGGLFEENGYLSFSVPSSSLPEGEIYFRLHVNDTWRMTRPDGSAIGDSWRAKNSTGGRVYLQAIQCPYRVNEDIYGFLWNGTVLSPLFE